MLVTIQIAGSSSTTLCGMPVSDGGQGMRYMVVERFKNGAAKAIYKRARERGRMLPDGLQFVDGWVSAKLDTYFPAYRP